LWLHGGCCCHTDPEDPTEPKAGSSALSLCLSCAPEVKEDEEGREREREREVKDAPSLFNPDLTTPQ